MFSPSSAITKKRPDPASPVSPLSTMKQPPPKTVRRRRTAARVMQDNHEKAVKNSHEAKAFHEAIKLWAIKSSKSKGTRDSCSTIVQRINRKYGTGVHKKTVRRILNESKGMHLEDIPAPRLGHGQKPTTPTHIKIAITNTLSSYIELCCAEMKTTPIRKDLIKRLEKCVKKVEHKLRTSNIISVILIL